jgi:hypothetical protein
MAQKDDVMRNLAKIATGAGLVWIGYKIVQGLSKNQSPTQIVQETVKPIEKVAAEVKSISKKLLKGSPEAKERMKKLRDMNKTPRGQGKRSLKKKLRKTIEDPKFWDNVKTRDKAITAENDKKLDAMIKKDVLDSPKLKYQYDWVIARGCSEEKALHAVSQSWSFDKVKEYCLNVPAVEMKESNSSEQKSDKVTAGRKGGKATAQKGKYKGHSSKKGLVQDQNKTSSEKHEKHYRKSKNKKR